MHFSIDRRTLSREVVMETYRASGPGGQHRNVTNSAVRLTHRPSGIVVVAADTRSQHQNKEIAFERLKQRLMVLNRVPRKRIPTKKTVAAKERTLGEKKRRHATKLLRGPVRSVD